MPKANWGISDEPDDLDSFDVYDGDKPPPGVYLGKMTRLQVKANKHGDPMLNALILVDEPKSSKKAQYNGYAIWDNKNVTEQGAPYVKAMLKALGLTWAEFQTKTILEGKMPAKKEDTPARVMKIGSVKFNDGDDVPVKVATKDNTYEGETRLQVTQYLEVRSSREAETADDTDEGDDVPDDAVDDDLNEPPF